MCCVLIDVMQLQEGDRQLEPSVPHQFYFLLALALIARPSVYLQRRRHWRWSCLLLTVHCIDVTTCEVILRFLVGLSDLPRLG